MVRHFEGRPQFGAFGAQHSLGWNAASRMYGDEKVQSRSRLRIPGHRGHPFRLIVGSDSD